MRVLVTGGRSFSDRTFIAGILDRFHDRYPISVLIHGACPTGADAIAADWAVGKGISQETYPADWERFGRTAGPIRNKQMVESGPEYVIVFPGGKGTAGCKSLARRAGLPIFEPIYWKARWEGVRP